MAASASDLVQAVTPAEFVVAVREMHEPYIPEIVSVLHTDPTDPNYNGGEWHEPTVEEKADSLHWWCDGCNTSAANCRVQHLLALVEV